MVQPHGGLDHRKFLYQIFGKVLTSVYCPGLWAGLSQKYYLRFWEVLNPQTFSGFIPPPHAFMHLHFCMWAPAPLRAAFSASRTSCGDASGLEENRDSESQSCVCCNACVVYVITYISTIAILAKAQTLRFVHKNCPALPHLPFLTGVSKGASNDPSASADEHLA